MVRKIPYIKRPVKFPSAGTRTYQDRRWTVFYLTVAVLAIPLTAKAESTASKNREGNKLFTEGRYEEAEKAYLEAQVKNPGKPEILYNLGNALIKQGKYPQGIQALQQSADKGNKRIKTNSRYNTGHALYSAGDYKSSAESFIETLKLDPGDMDAKHNLELALQKLREQAQQQQDEKMNQKDTDDQSERRPRENEEKQSTADEQDRKQADTRNDQEKPAKMKPAPPVAREGSITREQAQQILDAMRNQELDQQRRLLESRSRPMSNEKDW